MKKICIIMLLLFIAPNTIVSRDCSKNNCDQSQSVEKKNLKAHGKGRPPNMLDNLEEHIIDSLNGQISKLDNDLSLDYQKKTLSLKYDMNDKIPIVDSHFSITYKKRTVSLNYTIATW